MKYLIIALLVFGTVIKADEDTHEAAHFGVAFAAEAMMYGLTKKALRVEDKTFALVFSSVLVTSLSAIKEMEKRQPNPSTFKAALFGQACFWGTAFAFDF